MTEVFFKTVTSSAGKPDGTIGILGTDQSGQELFAGMRQDDAALAISALLFALEKSGDVRLWQCSAVDVGLTNDRTGLVLTFQLGQAPIRVVFPATAIPSIQDGLAEASKQQSATPN